MHIFVCIKQVPDTNNVRWTKENNLLREGMISILNPYDEEAINAALKIKEKFKNTKITAVSMGPKQAKNILEYALAKGCDEAILLCDKKFAGSDTLSTGKILSCAIKKLNPNFDMIICGQFALDGDTAQTGATVASCLDVPVVSYVDEIINADNKSAVLKQKHDDGLNIIEVKNPSVICVLKKEQKPLPLSVFDYVRAQDIGVDTYTLCDIELNSDEAGIMGSATYVCKTFKLEHKRDTKCVEDNFCDFLCTLIELEKKGG